MSKDRKEPEVYFCEFQKGAFSCSYPGRDVPKDHPRWPMTGELMCNFGPYTAINCSLRRKSLRKQK